MKKFFTVLKDDNRKLKRSVSIKPISASIELYGSTVPVEIKDYSFNGFGIFVPNKSNILESIQSKVIFPKQIFDGNIIRQVNLDQGIHLGFLLTSESKQNVDFNSYDSTWDQVSDHETLENIYKDLAFKGPEAPIQLQQMFTKAMLVPIEMPSENLMICEVLEIQTGKIEMGSANFSFNLFQTCHAFQTNIHKIHGNKIEIKLPLTLARLLRRETLRILKEDRAWQVKAILKSEILSRTIEEYEVYDYSEHGISLLDPKGELSIPRNLQFEDVEIHIKDIGIIRGKGELRSYQWNRHKHAYVVGIHFETRAEPNITNWHNFILKARYPNLDFNYQKEDHKKIWDLFERSNYLHFKDKETFTDIIDLTKGTWDKLNEAGTQIAKKALIRLDSEVVGHIQMDRVFLNTWCLHHLALDPSIRITVAQDLLTLTPDVLLTEKGEYVINFTDTNDSWNKKSYYNFVSTYENKEHNVLRTFKTYELHASKDKIDLKCSPNIKIRFANKFDIKRIQNHIFNFYKPIEIKALSLDNDIYLEKINSILSPFGLSRKREFLCAYSNDELLGYSILESGTEGINIIGVFNCCYIHLMDEQEENEGADVHETLLAHSIEYYRSKNIKYVILFLDQDTKDYTKNGIRFMCVANRWIAIKDVFSRFSAFTHLLYGHLNTKREKIRKKIKNK